MQQIIEKYNNITDEKYGRIITRFRKKLTHPLRQQETSLGNLFADILRESLGLDIMLLGSGSIRGQELGPIVDLGTLTEIFPYDDEIYMLKVNGEMLVRMIKKFVCADAFLGITEFYQLSQGLEVKYSKSTNEFEYIRFNGQDIQEEDIFTIGVQNFHFQNLEEFLNVSHAEVNELFKPRVVTTSTLDILEEYLSVHCRLGRDIEGRILVVD